MEPISRWRATTLPAFSTSVCKIANSFGDRPILPPQFGRFRPLGRVVAGFLIAYFFHDVAMHMK
jgi:hypothetical protein